MRRACPVNSLLLSAPAGRCHPVAGDNLELGFVSSLALQNLSAEYFGQPYVRPSLTSSLLPCPLAAVDIGRGGLPLLQRSCRIRTLGRRKCARRRFRRLRRDLCASPADPPRAARARRDLRPRLGAERCVVSHRGRRRGATLMVNPTRPGCSHS